MYQLHIANKNYSSWSLRPWILMRMRGIEFDERIHAFGSESFSRFSASGLVPCLIDGDLQIWDSASITEYLAERHAGVWNADPAARAWSRSVSAEMHSGFGALRQHWSMTCGVRIRPRPATASLQRDLDRIDTVWNQGLSNWGGPFLAGDDFTAVDACFAPVAFRYQTYGHRPSGAAAEYLDRLLALAPMHDWYQAALAETWRDLSHEREITSAGDLLADHRARSAAK